MKQHTIMKFIGRWIVATIAIYAVAHFLPGIYIHDFSTAILAGLALGFLNAIVRPILVTLTLPATILSFGLFILIINGFLLYLVGFMEGVDVVDFGTAIFGAILISLLSSIINFFIFPEERKIRFEVHRHH